MQTAAGYPHMIPDNYSLILNESAHWYGWWKPARTVCQVEWRPYASVNLELNSVDHRQLSYHQCC